MSLMPLPDADRPRQRPLMALAVRLAAAFCLATLSMIIKFASERGVGLPQMLVMRQLVTIPLLLGWMAMRGSLGTMRSERLGAHATRAMTGAVGMVLTFAAPIMLPLAVAATLGFTSPLFAVLLSFLILREHVGPWRWGATAVGFAGIVIVANPFGAVVSTAGLAIGLGAAFMVALISIQVRDLSRTEDPIAMVSWLAIFSIPLLLVASLFTSWNLDAVDWLLLVSIGLAGTLGQILLTFSLRLGTVSSVMVMDYSILIWSTFYSWSVFGALPPDTMWLGAPLIIAAGIIIVWREQIRSRQAAREPVG